MSVPSPADLASRLARATATQQQPSPDAQPVPERRYHSFARVDADGAWLEGAIDQVSTWLRASKDLDLAYDLDVDGAVRLDAGLRTLAFRRHDPGPGREHAIRFLLNDPSVQGLWTVEVLAVQDPSGGGWLSVETTNSEDRWVAVPSVMTGLMETLHMRDGGHDLSARPWVVDTRQVDDLLAVLDDPMRRGPVLIAGTDTGQPFDPFCDRVQRWAHDVRGLAHMVVLQPAAVQEFADRVGPQLATDPWTLRTYQPRFSMEDSPRRHRILSAFRVSQDSDAQIRRLVGRFTRGAIAGAQLPRELADWRRVFDRLENRKVAEALTVRAARPRRAPQALPALGEGVQAATSNRTDAPTRLPRHAELEALERSFRSDLDRIMATLGVPDLSDQTLEQIVEDLTAPRPDEASTVEAAARLERQQTQIEALERKVSELKGDIDGLEVELVERSEWASKLERQATFWQRRVIELGEFEAAHALDVTDELAEAPSTFADLFARAPELEQMGVLLSADDRHCAQLDAVDRTGLACETAWNAVRALASYLKARSDGVHTGDVESYLRQTPPGYVPFPPGKHRRAESEQTMAAYGHERVFPVPADVDSSGQMTMVAHVRLSQVGMVSPRLYYAITGDNRVVVGYIGPHLTNMMTN